MVQIFFINKIQLEEDDTQTYLVSQPIRRYFKRIAGVGNSNHIYLLKHLIMELLHT